MCSVLFVTKIGLEGSSNRLNEEDWGQCVTRHVLLSARYARASLRLRIANSASSKRVALQLKLCVNLPFFWLHGKLPDSHIILHSPVCGCATIRRGALSDHFAVSPLCVLKT